jgi:cobalt-zinc-cadmium efflux system membrane fusion protein
MKTNMLIRNFWLIVVCFLIACTKPEAQDNYQEEPEETAMGDSSPVKVPASQIIECIATIDVPPAYVYEIHSRVDGFIADLNILEGKHVKKGDLLARIESPEFALLHKSYREAAAQYHWQEQNYKRGKELYGLGSISPKEWQQIEKDFTTAQAQYHGLAEELKSIGFSLSQINSATIGSLEIRSNISGMVTYIGIRNGSRVGANTHMFTIIDKSHLHAEISIPVNHLSQIHKNTPFYMVQEGDTLSGHVFLINYQTDSQNMVKVHGHFDDESKLDNILVGQRVFVQFESKN